MDRANGWLCRKWNEDDSTIVFLGSRVNDACYADSSHSLYMNILQPLIDAYCLNITGTMSSQVDVCRILLAQCPRPDNI